MYDEFERAVTGRTKRGIPVFGWILIVVASLFMFGVVGVGFAAYKTANIVKRELSGARAGEIARELAEMERQLATELQGVDGQVAEEVSLAIREVRREMERSFGNEAPLYAANLLSRMGPEVDRILQNPAAGLALLQDLGSSDSPERALRDVLEGSLRIRTGDGEMLAELWSGEDGGSLVIQGADGEELNLDLIRADGGGALVIQSPEGHLRFGAGSEAEGLPGWVPEFQGMPANPQALFSVASEDGGLGAVSWETDRPLKAVMEEYRDMVSREGYRIREEHSAHSGNHLEVGFWAENADQGRVIFFSGSQEDGANRILLGYGEEIG